MELLLLIIVVLLLAGSVPAWGRIRRPVHGHGMTATGVAALIVAAGAVSSTHAATLVLSDYSSDETPASVLDGRLEFSVSGSVLTLTVYNDTSGDDSYFMNQVYFNATDNVSSLTLNPAVSGWSLATSQSAGGFGTYDFGLSTGNNDQPIAPGASLTFMFDIGGTGPFSDSNFTTELSTIPPGNTRGLAAAKWVRGPDDDSAFGATDRNSQAPIIPLPPAALMGLSLLAVSAGVARRRG